MVTSLVLNQYKAKLNQFEGNLRGLWDKLTSFSLLIVGLMLISKACGIGVGSIMAFGGLGGIIITISAQGLLQNLFIGLHNQISGRFKVGDRIQVGTLRGQVTVMALTAATLICEKKSAM